MIIKRFKEQVNKTPENIAVKWKTHEITYRGLYARSRELASGILDSDTAGGADAAVREQTAALLFEHGMDMIAGVLGALTAGKIYVPFDPAYPEKRLVHMLEDSGARLLVTNGQNLEQARRLVSGAPHPVEILDIDTIGTGTAGDLPMPGDTAAGEKDIAYILYTSGSTGKPKGVMQTHRNILHFIECYTSDLALTQQDRLTLFSAFSHDAAVMDIYSALLNGATLYPLNIKDTDITGLPHWLNSEGITVYHSVPTVYRYFMNVLTGEERFPGLRHIVLGGEAVLQEDVKRFQALFAKSGCAMVNLYGQSESSYNSAQFIRADEPFERVLLGEPVDETELLVIDEEGDEVRPFQVGEIVVAGPYVAPGYWKDPEKTEAVFDEDEELGRLYFTGDQGRLLLEGGIEFAGRTDFQVKIRGYRVELGEIETALLLYPDVKETVVMAREESDGTTFLYAYVVPQPGKSLTPAGLREYLLQELMEHMVPSYFMQLESLPKTATGKIDRKALPEVEGHLLTGTEYAAPTSPVEEQLARLWQEVLDLDRAGIDDNFFQVGGHSLKATVLAARVHKEMKVELPLKEIFRTPTIRGLARFIAEAGKSPYASIDPVEAQPDYPLSAAQRRLFALHRLDGQSTGYNMPGAVRIEGPLDLQRLESAFERLLQRHESLRTSFHLIDQEPRQKIHETVEFGLEQRGEGRGVFERGDKEEAPPGASLSSFIRPFDLSKAPLFRAAVLSLPSPLSPLPSLFIDMHHIISDGTSRGIIIRDLLAFYAGEEPAPLRVQYKDYAVWQQQLFQLDIFDAERTYWKDVFQGEIPVLELPADYPRPTVQSFEGGTYHFDIPLKVAEDLRALASKMGATLYMMLLAVLNLLLSRYSGQQDIVVGTGVAGRPHADLQAIVGMFVGTLAMRNFPSGEKTVADFIEDLRDGTLEAFDNQDYPFDDLVEQLEVKRDLSRNPLFDVMLVLQNIERTELEAEGLRFLPIEMEDKTAKFDLTFTGAEYPGGIGFDLEYAAVLFKPATIERMARHFVRLARLVTEQTDQTPAELDILDEKEKEQLLTDFNRTSTEALTDRTLSALFEEQAARTPDRTALTLPLSNEGSETANLSYGFLNRRANCLAQWLRDRGVGPNRVVGLMLERSPEMIVALLAVLKAGGAYLPIGPEFPQGRARLMLADSSAGILITRAHLADRVPAVEGVEVVDAGGESLYRGRGENLEPVNSPGDLAYVIYTSGTTGIPKGTMITHRGVPRLALRSNYVKPGVDDVLLQLSNYAFDGSVFDIWGSLLNGARLVLVPKETVIAADRLGTLIRREHVTVFFLTTALFNTLVELDVTTLEGVRHILFGGERVSVPHARKALGRLGPGRLLHMYGPTECTVYATYYPIDAIGENAVTVPIGKPLTGTELYVLDRYRRLQPVGVAGELYIGGDALGKGYLNHPELTAEKFPAGVVPGQSHALRLYQTGDLVRWLPDGNIEFLDRIDHQVKIRGFRIELGEIEAGLLSHEAVKEAVVTVWQDPSGSKHLCAYFSGEGNLSALELKEYLSRDLPGYMIPLYFIQLDRLPVSSATGKVNRKELPEPAETERAGAHYEPPADEIETRLAALWQDILSIGRVGRHDNFFEMGGHSLKATILSARVHRDFDVELPLPQVFKTPSLKGLAHFIRTAGQALYSAIEPAEKANDYPLSPAQRRIYTLENFEGEKAGTVYNMPLALEVKGNLDIARLQKAFQHLIRRHESLRTSFHLIDGEPRQKVHDSVDFILETLPTSPRAFIRPFDLSQAPLLRAAVFSLPSPLSPLPSLFIDMHHIISDGTSMGILVNDFLELYKGNELPPLRLQYRDYALWQQEQVRAGNIKEQEAFWQEQFSGDIPVLELPLDYPRPAVQRFDGAGVTVELSPEAAERLKRLAQEQGATLFMVLFGIYNIVLSRYTGQEDTVVGTPTAGRPHADLQGIIGMFVNTLALRGRPAGDKTVAEFLHEVKETTLRAFENQDLQFEALVESLDLRRDLGRNPLFDTMFTLQNLDIPEIQLGDLRFKPLELDNPVAKFDLMVTGYESPEGIHFDWQYAAHLFKKETVQRMARHFIHLARLVPSQTGRTAAELDILDQREKEQLLWDFNRTAGEALVDRTLPSLFEEQAARTPDRTALTAPLSNTGGESAALTYGFLNAKANGLAQWLRNRGVGTNQIVGLMLEPSPRMVIALLAVLKAGGAYLPMDPGFPQSRTRLMPADCGARLVITQAHLMDRVSFDGQVLDVDDRNLYPGKGDNLEPVNRPSDLAYVIYTSGTTGIPKGTMISHRGVPRVALRTNYIEITAGDVLLQLSNYAFDGSVFDIYGALLNGARLVLVPRETVIAADRLGNLIRRQQVTVFFLTTALFNTLVELDVTYLRGVRRILFGGERVSVPHARKALLHLGPGRLLHMYGPTECTVFTTYYPIGAIADGAVTVPIGKPLSGTALYVLDRYCRVQPVGVAGELYIGGDALGKGYLNHPGLTHEKFPPGTVTGQPSPLYKTGDLVRWLPDGNIEFLDRIDHQVKIRGFRIELGEIEARLLAHDAVKEAVVTVWEDPSGSKHLCAYFSGDGQLSPLELKEYLSRHLPGYMVPLYFLQLESLPVSTATGKVNRKALPEPAEAEGAGVAYEPPLGEVEIGLAALWQETLNIEQVGRHDNFFGMGGHSLKATILSARVHRDFNVQLPLSQVFKTPTLKGLAQYIRAARKADYTAIRPAEPAEYYPLSPAQKRLFTLERFEGADGGTVYNMPFAMTIEGPLDRKLLENAFQMLILRHESLRTSFHLMDGEPRQKVHDSVDFILETLPTSPRAFIQPFDLSQAPLLRAAVFSLPSPLSPLPSLFIDMHHIISDGTSMSILVREFIQLYEGKELPPLGIQYKDYAQWQHRMFASGGIQAQKDFWKEQFSGDIPVLELPLDYPRPAVQRFEGNTLRFQLDREGSKQLKKLAAGEETTLYMTLLAIYNILLSRYSGGEDIVTGTPTAGRPHEDLQNIIGMFVNTLALRNYPGGGKRVREFLGEVKDNTLKAFANQDFQLEEVVELLQPRRDLGRNPLFDTVFTLQNLEAPEISTETLRFFPIELENTVAKFDLMVTGYEDGEDLLFDWQFATGLFKKETIQRMARHFHRLIKEAAASPEARLQDLDILSEAEKEQVLVTFNDVGSDYPSDRSIPRLFEEQAQQAPDHVALVGTVTLTYGELNRRAGALAGLLQEKGVQKNTLVGLMTDRSVEMVIAILGILKAGGAYLPIDPTYPTGRIQYMLADSNLHLLLTDNPSYAQELITPGTDRFVTCPNPRDARGKFILVDVGSIVSDWDRLQTCPYDSESAPGDIAYVMYTSGTTGKPKAVVVEHRNVVRLVKNTNYIEFSRQDRILQTGNIVFDATTFELWGMLLNGGGLVLEGKDIILDAVLLGEALGRHRISILWLTALLFNQLIDQDARIFAGLKYLLAGGDVLSPPHVNKVRAACPGLTVINGYGPTENTTFSTCHRIQQTYGRNIPIGAPIANSTAYIIDRYGAPVPIGVVGELWLGGDGVARGYLNRPDLTAGLFIPQDAVFNRSYPNGARLYRSGDLARWLPHGVIEFMGRIDHQVKIRGFRIETGEIETQLLAHGAVLDAVVIPRDGKEGHKYLCAYLAVEKEVDLPGLREHLLKELPDYMIPSYFVQMPQLPLNPNGKVDRKALPEPESGKQSGVRYEAPADTVEARLVDLWQELLDAEPIGVHDNFFETGGHSLKATQLSARVSRDFGVQLPLTEIFRTPTVRGQASFIKNARKADYAALQPVEPSEYYPLSSAQRRIYTLDRFEGEGTATAYNMPFALIVQGRLEHRRLEATFQQLVQRHESLRTSFHTVEGEPKQKVHEQVIFALKVIEPEPFGPPAHGDAAPVLERIIREFVRPFQLSGAPLFRVGTARLGENKHLLVLDMHHVISDGTSIGILVREFGQLYGGEALPLPRIQYKDYASRQQKRLLEGRRKDLETFWKDRFSGTIPVLEMPTDYPRPPVQQFDGATKHAEPGPGWTDGVDKLAASYGATRYMVLLAVYNALLSCYSHQEDIVVGTPIAGRPHADLETMVGMFVNTLALRNYPKGQKTFGSFLKEIKEQTLLCFENQDYQFEELVEILEVPRDFSRNPLFDTMFSLQNLDIPAVDVGVQDPRFSSFQVETATAKFDLVLMGYETETEQGEGMSFDCQYGTRLFRPETVERFLVHFITLARRVAENPDTPLGKVDILSDDEKQQLLVDFNDTGDLLPPDKTIHRLFEEQAARTPEAAALVGHSGRQWSTGAGGGLSFSYETLDRGANRLAHYLRSRGVGEPGRVGILAERCVEMITGLLAILKTGNAYVPLNPAGPADRARFMLEECGVSVVLTHSGLPEQARPPGDFEYINIDDVDAYADMPQTPPPAEHCPGDFAYVIFTSGTTGLPKGVPITHANFSPLVHWGYRDLGLGTSDRVFQNLSYYFDWSVWEIFIGLTTGAALYMVPEEVQMNPEAGIDFILENKITVLHVTPTQYGYYLNTGRNLETLTHLFIGAEKLPLDLVRRSFLSVGDSCRVFNMYGPTEATIIAAVLELERGTEDDYAHLGSVPIGVPVGNTDLFILDKYSRPCPVNVVGDLYIGGDCIARGYLNRPELTAEKFLEAQGDRQIYHTGDLARWLPDGTVEFLGRIDHQVKIRGFRIETGEIETALLDHQEVQDAVVLAREDKDGNNYLCAYLVLTQEQDQLTAASLREFLLASLPDYMVPAFFIFLEHLPLNANGKVDRKALPEPEGAAQTGAQYEAPANDLEKQLAHLWQELLNREQIGVYDNFFEIGGHSLKATQLTARVYKDFKVRLPLADVFQAPTIRALAHRIGAAQPSLYAEIPAAPEAEYYPLTPAQKRLFALSRFEAEDVSTGYNMPFAMTVRGPLDTVKLETAFRDLVQRHESLRTSFHLIDGEPAQKIHESVPFNIEPLPPSPGSFVRPFDLSEAPLLRVGLSSSPASLFIDMHHIISDGTSAGIIIREFAQLYEEKEPAPLRIQYKDFALWHRDAAEAGKTQRQEQFWKQQFSGTLPVLNLATDFPRPTVQSYAGGLVSICTGPGLASELRQLAAASGTTLFMVMLAAYNLLLSKYTGGEDMVVGSVTAGREHADLQDVIGMFINTLALRNRPSGELTFGEFLEKVKTGTLACFENQDYPFEALVELLEIPRDLGRNPLFDTMFVLQNIDMPETRVGELVFETLEQESNVAKFDLSVTAGETEEGLELALEYASALFKRETVERLGKHFCFLLEQAACEPGKRLREYIILPPAERRQVLETFNDMGSPLEAGQTFLHRFHRQAEQTPDRVALTGLVAGEPPINMGQLTYAGLLHLCRAGAAKLKKHGCGPDRIVGLMTERSLDMAVGILTILEAGGAYLPMDPAYPRARLKYMLEDSAAALVLTDGTQPLEGIVPEGVDIITLALQEADAGTSVEPESREMGKPGGGDLAYVIYTSGTTGRPKGVPVSHGNLMTYLGAFIMDYGPTGSDVLMQQASYAFDAFVDELYPYLMVGGKIVISPKDTSRDIRRFALAINRYGVTMLSMAPLLLNELDKQPVPVPALRLIISGGDVLKPEYCTNLMSHVKVYNSYGPTETTVGATIYPVSPGDGPDLPIGRPHPNYRLYVLDRHLQPLPIGIPGELCISGPSVTRGYLNRPELTSEKFIRIFPIGGPGGLIKPIRDGAPWRSPRRGPRRAHGAKAAGGNTPLYRTGDLARWLPDGNVQFLGRMDNQVSLRGFRVELGEIESRLARHPGVKEAVVTVGNHADGTPYLCAYFTAERKLTEPELREYLAGELPEYMIPAFFTFMEKFPVTPNGKIDKKALPDPREKMLEEAKFIPPRDPVEETLAAMWRELLQLERVGIHDNFFTLGGDSLKAIRMLSQLQTDFEITLNDIFRYQTVARLAENIHFKKDSMRLRIEALKQRAMEAGADEDDSQRVLRPQLEVYREKIRYYERKELSETKTYEHILLTGATGYLGVHLLKGLLESTDARLYVLVRGKTLDHAMERLAEKIHYYFREDLLLEYSERLEIFNGDLTEELLGLPETLYELLAQKVDCIVNPAAYVKHYGHEEDFHRMNVEGTQRLIDFALYGRKKDLNHMSTTTVGSGTVEGKEYALFTEYDTDIGQQMGNIYANSKLESERLVVRAREKGLNANIFRVGNLVFHSATGRFQENIGENAFYLLLKSFIKLGFVPDVRMKMLDFCFIDYAAESILRLYDKKALANHTHHIHNSNYAGVYDLAVQLGEAGTKLKLVSFEEYLDYLYRHYDEPEARPYIETILLHTHILESAGPGGTDIILPSERTDFFLERLDFHWPELNRDHVAKMLEHCYEVKFL